MTGTGTGSISESLLRAEAINKERGFIEVCLEDMEGKERDGVKRELKEIIGAIWGV